jgi:hypothetical protein
MTPPQVLEVGSKLIGLYVLVASLPLLLSATIGLLLPGAWEQTSSSPVRIYIAISVLGLVIYALLGWVLLRKSKVIVRYAFGNTDALVRSSDKNFFTIGVKLLGVFTAMTELLTLVRVLSNSTTFARLSGEHKTIFEWIGVATNYLPPLILVLAGTWLFFRGELLSGWAFAEHNSPDDVLDI